MPPLPPVPPPKIPPKRADEPEHTDPSKPHQTHSLDQHPVFEDDQHTKRERGPNYHIFETSFVDGLASTLVSHPYTERPNPHSAIQQDPPDIPPEGPGYAERPDGVGSMLTSAVMGQQNPSERPAIPSDNQQHAISKTPSTQPGVCTSETQEQKNDEKSFETMATEANRNSSFYWHSSHSSASIVQEGEQVGDNPASSTVIDSAPDPPDEPASTADYAPSSKVTDMYESILGPYSASALGLGGPSDWEHFGDYDGEEIDDTDLYTRHKPQPETDYLERSAELPADSSTDRDEGTDPANSVGKPSVDIVVSPQADKSVQSTIVPAAPDQTEVASSVAENVHSYDPESALQEAVRTSDEPLTLPPTAPESQTGESQNTTPEECTDASAPVRVLQSPTRPDIIADNGSLGQHLDGKSQTSSDATPARSNTDGTKNQAPFIHDSEHRLKSERQDDGSVGTNGRTDDLPDTQNVAAKPPKGASDGASPTQDHADDLSASKSIPDPGSRASVLSDRIGTPKVDITDDPFAKLDPWAKASLNRYVMMLHEEAQAQTNEDKFRIFKAFSHNETKLRAVIYGADDRPESMPSALATSQPASQNRPLTLRRPSSKALPALPPPDDNTSDDERGVEPEMRVPTSRADPIKSPTKPTAGALHTSEERLHIVTGSSNHAHEVQSEVDIKEAYSPGGRPIQPRISAINKLKSNAGDLKGQISEPSRSSVYKPFRYSQGFFEETATSLNRRTSYRPYAALKLQPLDLHPSHRESPVIFDEKTAKDATSSAHSERNEVLGTTENVTESSKASSSSPQKASSAENDKNEALDLRRFEKADFDPLVSVLPPTGVIPPESIHLQDLQHRMEAIPDDFSFIHQSMVTWDVKAKQRREEHEKQRQLRQGQSEQKIDALFNDDEIGYGDISELESEFKRSEASRKAGEDRAEYQTFVGEVFDVVWTRLHYEIDQLSPMYQEYTEIAHRTLAGKDMFEAASGQFALAPTMGSLLTLHQKLEVRHQKAFEAVLERDRRLKKTEISPWYALGNVTKVKQLEKQFDHAEKNAIVEFCYQRDARANRLMDVLDQNTLRGYVNMRRPEGTV